jgi:hypothetical protein
VPEESGSEQGDRARIHRTQSSIDIQDNEEEGHDQNEGVVEEGTPPPPSPL